MPFVHVVRDLANQKVVTGATAGIRQLTGNEWDFCRVEVQVVAQTRHVRIDRPQRFPARWDGMTRDMGSSTWDMDGPTRAITRTPGNVDNDPGAADSPGQVASHVRGGAKARRLVEGLEVVGHERVSTAPR